MNEIKSWFSAKIKKLKPLARPKETTKIKEPPKSTEMKVLEDYSEK